MQEIIDKYVHKQNECTYIKFIILGHSSKVCDRDNQIILANQFNLLGHYMHSIDQSCHENKYFDEVNIE